jgi:hypothetical protein
VALTAELDSRDESGDTGGENCERGQASPTDLTPSSLLAS